MFVCRYCGLESTNERAKFCSECGPNGPAVEWEPSDVDRQGNLERYLVLLQNLLNKGEQAVTDDLTGALRSQLKISHQAHLKSCQIIEQDRLGSQALKVWYNKSFSEAYAGHDTFIEFKIKNVTPSKFFKLSFEWDDPATADRIDLRVQLNHFMSPGETKILGTNVIFDRSGWKELTGLQLDVFDELDNKSSFELSPIRVRVTNPNVNVQNSYSSSNSISIEGRGVVDASGLGQTEHPEMSRNTEDASWVSLQLATNLDTLTSSRDIIAAIYPLELHNFDDTYPSHAAHHEAEKKVVGDILNAKQQEELAQTVSETLPKSDLTEIEIELATNLTGLETLIVRGTNANSSSRSYDMLIEDGQLLRAGVTPVVRVSDGSDQVELKSPIDGLCHFDNLKKVDDNCEIYQIASVSSFNLKEFIVSAELIISDSIRPNCGHQHVEKLISDIHVTDIPYSLDITLEYIEGSIPENGIVGSAKCSFFDTSIPIALNNHSLLIGVPLLPSLDIGQPIKCNLRNKNHGEKTVHHLCKLQATEFILDVVGLAQYFSEPIKEITFFYLYDQVHEVGQEIIGFNAGDNRYSILGNKPLILHSDVSSYIDNAPDLVFDMKLRFTIFGLQSEQVNTLFKIIDDNGEDENTSDQKLVCAITNVLLVKEILEDGGDDPASDEDTVLTGMNINVSDIINVGHVIGAIGDSSWNREICASTSGIVTYVSPDQTPVDTDHMMFEIVQDKMPFTRYQYFYRDGFDGWKTHLINVPEIPYGDDGQLKVTRWHKAEGDEVSHDEIICTLGSWKVSCEINSEKVGVLKKIIAPIGTVVGSGNPLGLIKYSPDTLSTNPHSVSVHAGPGEAFIKEKAREEFFLQMLSDFKVRFEETIAPTDLLSAYSLILYLEGLFFHNVVRRLNENDEVSKKVNKFFKTLKNQRKKIENLLRDHKEIDFLAFEEARIEVDKLIGQRLIIESFKNDLERVYTQKFFTIAQKLGLDTSPFHKNKLTQLFTKNKLWKIKYLVLNKRIETSNILEERANRQLQEQGSSQHFSVFNSLLNDGVINQHVYSKADNTPEANDVAAESVVTNTLNDIFDNKMADLKSKELEIKSTLKDIWPGKEKYETENSKWMDEKLDVWDDLIEGNLKDLNFSLEIDDDHPIKRDDFDWREFYDFWKKN